MRLYIGNLPYSTTAADLREMFAAYGTVIDVEIVQDKHSGHSRGFGFVEMHDESEGQAAIRGLEDAELQGRRMHVQPARPERKFGSD
jgi:RNA recognition motif-containing protein